MSIILNFSLFEADPSIFKIANNLKKENPNNKIFVLSNDSDFLIYDVPNYVNFSDLKFPNNTKNDDLKIEYKSNNSEIISKSLDMDKEIMPICGTLCGNDSIIIYNNIKKHIKEFKTTEKFEKLEFISVEYEEGKKDYVRKIIIFVLCMIKQAKSNNISNPKYSRVGECKDLTELQKEVIKQLFEEIKKWFNNKKQWNKFQIEFVNSVREYIKTSNIEDCDIKKNKAIIKKYKGNSFYCDNKNIINKISFLDEQILDNYYSGNINNKILNILINNYYLCVQYFENLEKENCWNITYKLRKEICKIMLNLDTTGNYDQDVSIKELRRKGFSSTEIRLTDELIPIKREEIKFNSVDERFKKYINLFHLDINDIKKFTFLFNFLCCYLSLYLKSKSRR
ncbi:hypothetical protein BCR36DRAFT_371281 [Piromyces finnis]|uniref:Asteroid domain-containing protein n=1 Tax=Piromyces finnis TaxID=1754191 RepID=A0A1Y1V6L9_9FUNG|nr:hypothetical protein BCR36DRAFT_371281 [Piromyces finnis]|eukprot:ORX48430.1 hypothetical protein BCR36DRAFT_371281 [Piromyces finnis]